MRAARLRRPVRSLGGAGRIESAIGYDRAKRSGASGKTPGALSSALGPDAGVAAPAGVDPLAPAYGWLAAAACLLLALVLFGGSRYSLGAGSVRPPRRRGRDPKIRSAPMNAYVIVSGALALYLILVWFLATLLGLKGSDIWILRGALALIGLAAAGLYMLVSREESGPAPGSRRRPRIAARAPGIRAEVELTAARSRVPPGCFGSWAARSDSGEPPGFPVPWQGGIGEDIDGDSLRPRARAAGRARLPGEPVAPTRTANLWFGRRAVLAEAGGKLLSDAGSWSRLLQASSRHASFAWFGRGEQAPSAVVVCFSSEASSSPGPARPAAVWRATCTRGWARSRSSSVCSFPVYVIFTKMNRIAFFEDYVRNLTNDEAGQVSGATMPIAPLTGRRRLCGGASTAATDRLPSMVFYSQGLADHRLTQLPREDGPDEGVRRL